MTSTRLVMLGRNGRLEEVVIHDWPDRPRTGTLHLRRLGPVDARAVRVLIQEAEYHTRHGGYHTDTFFVTGAGPSLLVALIPADPCPPGGADDALRQISSW